VFVRGQDASGLWGPEVKATVDITERTSNTLIKGVAFGNPDLTIYNYTDGSTFDTGQSLGSGIGGIGDWNSDGNFSEVAFDNSNNKLAIYDKSKGQTTEIGDAIINSGILSFFGDFNDDGKQNSIAFLGDSGAGAGNGGGTKTGMFVAANASNANGYEIYGIRRVSTGSDIPHADGNSQHITGTRDTDGDGNLEFAYIEDGNQQLVIAEIVRVNDSTNEIFVRLQITETSANSIGSITDADADGQFDDIVFEDANDNLNYYDYSSENEFLLDNKSVQSIGGAIDIDGDGVYRVYYTDGSDKLRYKIVTKVGSVNTGQDVSNGETGGAN